MKKILLFSFVFMILLVNLLEGVFAAHYIIGIVNDSLDEKGADGHTVVLWNNSNGISDNVTGIIGPSGNSGVSNWYMINCELLSSSCAVGEELSVKVINNGDDYISRIVNVSVTGAGFDLAPNLILNSPPNVTQTYLPDTGNFSSLNILFNCSAQDLDGNLANISLYGNWSGGWHKNETKNASGVSSVVSFSKNISEGVYEWGCFVSDNLSITNYSTQNFTINVDNTPPLISSIVMNESYICGTSTYVRVNCTSNDSFTGVENVTIRAIGPSSTTNYSASLLLGDVYYADVLVNEVGTWVFNCISEDYAENSNNLISSELETYLAEPELAVYSSFINFSNLDPLENEIITISVVVFNLGCGNAINVLTGFYKGDPDLGGVQINGNQSANVSGLSNETVNVSWSAEIGSTNVFVGTDINDLFLESNESDNKANDSIIVNAWQEFYGNMSIEKILSNGLLKNLTLWSNESFYEGSVFVTDSEADINWASLQAIGQSTTNVSVINDFMDIDALLGMSDFNDSVTNIFGDPFYPKFNTSFLVHKRMIEKVPIINSTNTTSFITGILWDMDDDSDGQFDQGDKEDLVFVVKTNTSQQGGYGIYDYEITLPVRLREYNSTDISDVYFYYDLY